MDRGYVYRPVGGNLRIKNKAQCLLKRAGESFHRSVGDNSGITQSQTIEETEVYSNETPDKDLAVLDVHKAEPTLSIVLRELTDTACQILWMTGASTKGVGQAVVDQAFGFVGMKAGDIADLGVEMITEIEITEAGWTRGTHYEIDHEAGRFECIALPDGSDGDVAGTVTGTKGVLPVYGIMDKTQQRYGVIIRTNNRFGRNWEIEYWNVQLRTDGDLPLSADGDDFGEVTLNGRVFADASKPAALRFGRVRELPRRAA